MEKDMATNKKPYIKKQLQERLLEALETERAGIKIYEAALVCAINMNLRSEWGEYLKQTRSHEHVLLTVFEEMGLDPDTKNLCRDEVTRIGDSLVSIMLMAKANGTAETAQLVAGECVVLAETKNNQNYQFGLQ
ncbi:MAG: hypothetical protein Q8K94_09840, partial [Moraxellaceae bacterium]|nr:hypothetical protein [Moraxellaceae bacterium]